MMCTPAFRRVSTSVESPIVRNTQSTSPFGPPTKPSRETDIFNTSFLFVPVEVAIISPEVLRWFIVFGRLVPIWSLHGATTYNGGTIRRGTGSAGEFQSLAFHHRSSREQPAVERPSVAKEVAIGHHSAVPAM